MSEHPIEGLMTTAMNSIKDMVDVNTIIGEPIETSNNILIIPISKVSFGFVAGGSEFTGETIDEYKKIEKEEQIQYKLPFGGGSGAGVSINPVAFLIVQPNGVKLMPVNHSSTVDKLLDYVPEFIDKTNNMMNKVVNNKKDQSEKIIKEIRKKTENINKDPTIIKKENIKKPTNIEYEYEYDETEKNETEDF